MGAGERRSRGVDRGRRGYNHTVGHQKVKGELPFRLNLSGWYISVSNGTFFLSKEWRGSKIKSIAI